MNNNQLVRFTNEECLEKIQGIKDSLKMSQEEKDDIKLKLNQFLTILKEWEDFKTR